MRKIMAGMAVLAALGIAGRAAADAPGAVELLRVPNEGIQPQAIADAKGTLHLIYFKGSDARAGDLFYVRRKAREQSFSDPVRVNSAAGSVCAMGGVRGGQIALGREGRLHVVWNGGMGMLYARLEPGGAAFEPQRNLTQVSTGMDGGGTVAADDAGSVYVAWHALPKGGANAGAACGEGEEHRKLWVARSSDDGRSFSVEAPAWKEETGACGCCSTRAFADGKGSVYLMYRSATGPVTNRDMYLLFSKNRGQDFRGVLLHPWKVPT